MARTLCGALVSLLLAVMPAGRPATAAGVPTISTGTGFGQLFVLAADSQGNLYVADQNHYAILKLSPSGRLLLRDQMPRQCGISGLVASTAGGVYAVANCKALVYHFSPTGRLLRTFGRQPPGPGGVALDAAGGVYVAYGPPAGAPPRPPGAPPGARVLTFANRFVQYTAAGVPLRTVHLPGLHLAWGIAVGGGGSVYVTGQEALVKVSPGGTIVRRWNRITPPQVRAALPAQPAVDRQGNVYAADAAGNLLKISAAGRMLGTIVRHGAGPGQLQQPEGLTVAGGRVFVGDAGSNRIKVFSPTGVLQAVWLP